MFIADPTELRWRKSSRSDGDSKTSNCVEVAPFEQGIAIRDSKNTSGGILTVSAASWASFLASARR